jgi:hypothetical protein
MLAQSLIGIFTRDLGALRRELEAYPDEEGIWLRPTGHPNSAGVLARHLAGNLQPYIGAVLGGSGYRRDREAEFQARPWSRARLLAELAQTERVVLTTLEHLTAEQLAARYPEAVGQRELGTADFLVHLAVHCGFHLGQVDYHRRTVTGAETSITPMGVVALATAREVQTAP